jgi:hypothetical protein
MHLYLWNPYMGNCNIQKMAARKKLTITANGNVFVY